MKRQMPKTGDVIQWKDDSGSRIYRALILSEIQPGPTELWSDDEKGYVGWVFYQDGIAKSQKLKLYFLPSDSFCILAESD